MLVDSDVMIWYLRGDLKALSTLNPLPQFSISAITYLEILQGMRNKKELLIWKAFLRNKNIRIILIDHEITAKALFWTEEFCLSHRLRFADAFIAATADVYGLTLMTGNINDYHFLPKINLKLFKSQ